MTLFLAMHFDPLGLFRLRVLSLKLNEFGNDYSHIKPLNQKEMVQKIGIKRKTMIFDDL